MPCYQRFVVQKALLSVCVLVMLPAVLVGQSATGTLSGRVTDIDGGVIQGATVTLSSPALQGDRTAATSENGDYNFRSLPPGTYTLAVRLPGFATDERTVRVAPSEAVALNVSLVVAGVTESVSVVAEDTSFVNTVQAAASLPFRLVDMLPTDRTLLDYVNLAPGTHATGPDGNFSISGAMSFQNLFLLNGAVIHENLRSEPLDLYIEDAIQEAAVATSGISAEYGRFTGGVVNVITKSGGNMFSGSFRTALENDDWRTTTPIGEPKADVTVPTYMATLGGPILRDRLWFFGAVRTVDEETARQTIITEVPYLRTFSQQRYEGKVTLGLPGARRVQVGYLGLSEESANSASASIGSDVLDLRSLIARRDPQSLVTANYSGAVGASLVLEAQYSGRRLTIEDAGGLNPDRVQGTPILDGGTGGSFWAPGFCGACDEERNNDNLFLKGSWFTSTAAGAHHVVFGYDTFNDRIAGDNRQSASDFWIISTGANISDAGIFPVLDGNSLLVHWPLLESSRGTNFRTHAVFLNDTWSATRNLTLNLGVRYDANRGRNALDQLVADGSVVSPRLGLVWDPAGDGQTTFNASYGRYVAGLANSIANSSSNAGLPAIFVHVYEGPAFNTDPNAPQVPTPDVLAGVFDWYDANQDNLFTIQTTLPGVDRQIRGSLKSPHADELAVGVSRQLGSRAALRVDVVDCRFGNFYADRNDTTTGTVSNANGEMFDLTLVENTNVPERRYTGMTLLSTYRAGARLDLGASYTLSRLRGNIDGENLNSGPLTAGILRYPEYFNPAWSFPEGDLSADQRHRARLWGNFLLPVGGDANLLSLGVLQSLQSGTPYGASAAVSLLDANQMPYVADHGYLTPPITALYHFTARDEFHTDAMYRTDLSLNYQRRFGGTRGLELFAQLHFLNVFNQFQAFNMARGGIDTVVLTSETDASLIPFNPFTETPQQGVHWEYGSRFGEPVTADAYTLPRTFRGSLGFRF